MKEETAKRLYRAARRLGYTGKYCDRDQRVGISNSYSGRGMYGKQTYSITIPNIGYLAMLAAAARVKRVERDDFAEEMRTLRSDNMGMDIVVY